MSRAIRTATATRVALNGRSEPTARPKINNVQAAAWMLGASMCSAGFTITVKGVSTHLSSPEITFIRSICGVISLAPLVLKHGWSIYRTARPDLHVVRILCSGLGVMLAVYSVAHLQLATAVTLSYTRPLFMIGLAQLLLNEKVDRRRGIATLMGFAGVLVVMGPSGVPSLRGAFAALAAAGFMAGSLVIVRRQAADDGPATVMVWLMSGLCIMTAIPALFTWQTPPLADVGLLVLISVLGSGSQYMSIRAFTLGEATVLNPIDYSQILFTTTAGYFLYAEVPTIWTILGSAVITASTFYIVFRKQALPKATAAADERDSE
jgi:drug/metabolite transporter (DMT)-like permease